MLLPNVPSPFSSFPPGTTLPFSSSGAWQDLRAPSSFPGWGLGIRMSDSSGPTNSFRDGPIDLVRVNEMQENFFWLVGRCVYFPSCHPVRTTRGRDWLFNLGAITFPPPPPPSCFFGFFVLFFVFVGFLFFVFCFCFNLCSAYWNMQPKFKNAYGVHFPITSLCLWVPESSSPDSASPFGIHVCC